MGEIRVMRVGEKTIPVEFQKKHIKRMHLHVKGREGRVILSAPFSVPRRLQEAFIIENLDWIEEKRRELRNRPSQQPHRYLTGETIDLWGERKVLVLRGEPGERFRIDGGKAFLYLPEGIPEERRIHFVREAYRQELLQRMREEAPQLEARTGLKVNEWRTKDMKTRWGTCNIEARRIWINLQLVTKPPVCLHYVMLHEILHLVERRHDQRFYALMDRFLTDWRQVWQLLEMSPGNC